jgi:hypothetical protein
LNGDDIDRTGFDIHVADETGSVPKVRRRREVDAKPLTVEGCLEVLIEALPRCEVAPALERPVEYRKHVQELDTAELLDRVFVDESQHEAVFVGDTAAARTAAEQDQDRQDAKPEATTLLEEAAEP